ncbi:hypothetical protein [Burkholderia pseudomallei]|uniref:hypothetical protein n=1 Tax=Burkholderia pseudomallei TaxID=28450 RepID=UPI00193CD7E1|nr:hypothetical protein [Burkholderia pseudomallei]QRM23532.1 hypothetical protein JQX71_04405 [Burkholderia pseudomallei]
MARTVLDDALEMTAGAMDALPARPTFDELGTLEMLFDQLRDNGALCEDDLQALTVLTGKYWPLFAMVGLPENAFRAEGAPITAFDCLYWKAKLALLRAAIEYLA